MKDHKPNIGSYPFELLQKIEDTNMSQTWLARTKSERDPKKMHYVVIKIARRDHTEIFTYNQNAIRNEEEWLRKFQLDGAHPHLIQLLPIFRSGGKAFYSAKTKDDGEPYYIIVDYLAGGSLKELLEKKEKLEPRLAIHIALIIAKALAYVHGKGCVHLDIKPDNIIFQRKLHDNLDIDVVKPVLIDFGIARENNSSNYIGGVDNWLAPECKKAKSERLRITIRSEMDIYPFGLLFYYMLTGRHPRERKIRRQLTPDMFNGGFEQSADINEIVQRLNLLIQAMTADEPRERHSARRIEQELTELLALTAPLGIEKRPKAKRRYPYFYSIAVVALMLLAFVTLNPNGWLSTSPDNQIPTLPSVNSGANSTETSSAVASAITATLSANTATATLTWTPTLPPPTETAITATPTATTRPTDTPQPTETEKPAPLQTATLRPTSTRIQRATATYTPTASPTSTFTPTATRQPPVTQAVPQPVPSRRVRLIEPQNNTAHSGNVTFRWQADFALGTNEHFEIAYWHPDRGKDTARGFKASGTYTSAVVDLGAYHEYNATEFLANVPYRWAIRIVNARTGRPIQWVSDEQIISYNGK